MAKLIITPVKAALQFISKYTYQFDTTDSPTDIAIPEDVESTIEVNSFQIPSGAKKCMIIAVAKADSGYADSLPIVLDIEAGPAGPTVTVSGDQQSLNITNGGDATSFEVTLNGGTPGTTQAVSGSGTFNFGSAYGPLNYEVRSVYADESRSEPTTGFFIRPSAPTLTAEGLTLTADFSGGETSETYSDLIEDGAEIICEYYIKVDGSYLSDPDGELTYSDGTFGSHDFSEEILEDTDIKCKIAISYDGETYKSPYSEEITLDVNPE